MKIDAIALQKLVWIIYKRFFMEKGRLKDVQIKITSPSPSVLTHCHLPQRGRLWRFFERPHLGLPLALPLGELSSECETERVRMLRKRNQL